jgi:tetratricopeptide (TPR) repeat protein
VPRRSRYLRAQPCRRLTLFVFLLASPAAAGIEGSVLLDDAVPPASPIAVELYCGGVRVAGAAVKPDGRFSLPQVPQPGCTISATLAGYAPAAISADSLPLDPQIPGLALRREGKWQGHALSATTLSAHPEALRLYAAGVGALRAGGQRNMAQAERRFAEAAAQDPSFAEAFFQLARLRLSREDLPGAHQALAASLAADPWFVSPYTPLLLLEVAAERWAAVRDLCTEWHRLEPQLLEPRFYRALSFLERDQPREAALDLHALESDPGANGFPPLLYLRGRMLQREGRVEAALSTYRAFLYAEPESPLADDARERLRQSSRP